MRAFVIQNACIGCGLCTGTAPGVFRMNNAGKAEAFADAAPAVQPDVDAAVDGCPVGAICEEA